MHRRNKGNKHQHSSTSKLMFVYILSMNVIDSYLHSLLIHPPVQWLDGQPHSLTNTDLRICDTNENNSYFIYMVINI